MSIIIQYPKQFSKEIKDFIIVLSKISELNNIKNLPFNAKFLCQSKEIEKTLKDKHFYESFIPSNSSQKFYNIKIVIITNLKADESIFDGAKLFSKFSKNSNNDLNFIFSNKLINSYNNVCSNFIFGLLLKSYSFLKYKKKKNRFQINTIKVYSSKNNKLKNFNNLNNLLISINYTKDLVSETFKCFKSYFHMLKKCLELKKLGIQIKILNLQQIKKNRYGVITGSSARK